MTEGLGLRYSVDRNIDVFAVTETWLAKETDEFIIHDLCPTGYEFYNVPRVSRVGGGIGVIHKTVVCLEKHAGIVTSFQSFEFTDVLLKHSSSCLRLVIVYRPQTMADGTSSTAKFFEEFASLLESLVTAPGSLLMVGDFNFHVNDASDRSAQWFLRLLEAFNLKQHVWVPTHRSGNTLDLVITRADERTARDFDVFDPVISDHYLVSCSLALPKKAFERREVNYRKLKLIDLQELSDDISDSPLVSAVDEAGHDLESLLVLYNTSLIGLLDKHAPLKTRTITIRPSAPWYTEDIREEKQKRRALERRWRRTGLTVDRERFVEQCHVVNEFILQAKRAYYSRIIDENQYDPKRLFSIFDKLLHRNSDLKLPDSMDDEFLANAFADYFTEKINTIREGLQSKRGTTNHAQVELPYTGSEFNHFKSVSCDELSNLVPRSTLKSCMLDPIPASVLKNCYDLLLPFITKVVNCSLQNCTLTSDMKRAIVRPSLKKPSLDYQLYKNYRPISNLMFLSKCCEKVVASQFISHLRENELEETFQSAYKMGHSTESALLRVHNDVLCALDEGRCVMLVLLDLSAAFDTVDHGILLSRLSHSFGVQGSAYTWFESYLSSRSQFVQIRDTSSSDRQLTCGLPQGSVLGPILYLVYTSPLGAILRRHGVGFHMYADDTQLYLGMKTTKVEDIVSARTRVEVCLRELNQWMLRSFQRRC